MGLIYCWAFFCLVYLCGMSQETTESAFLSLYSVCISPVMIWVRNRSLT